ncbi:hypothetical protein L0128_21120 [candidate division KSB1 bacterium]|nr:hypothetical protein [candidate division KSB1 bacterium]
MNFRRLSISIWVLLGVTVCLFGADMPGKQGVVQKKITTPTAGPIVPDNWKYHKIGTLWQRVTNFGYAGDDAYVGRTPSCDYPGGSGNSYLYRGSLWLTAEVDGVVHSTQSDDHEFAPIDSVHVITGAGAISEEDTYTRYYDIQAPLAADHTPLGLEVTEHTYAWSESFRDDFIIYKYVIKNVGIDTDGDGYPDKSRDLKNFYFTYRMDADVSKLPNWDAEYRFSNQDDLGACNATWDWFNLISEWTGIPHGLTAADADSQMMFMWDGDNPSYPADNGEANDAGNPGPDGTLQTPGFIGFRVLKTIPASFKVSSFHQNHIYNDPATDKESYDRMMVPKLFEGPIVSGGKPFPYDYRAILSVGPKETLAAGDSVVVTIGLGVGSDPVRGGLFSLVELVKIMKVAQLIVDVDYQIASLAPPAPGLELGLYTEAGITKGVKVKWDNTPLTHENFQGFKVWKSVGKTAAGSFDWKPLGLGTYVDTTLSTSWPPPAGASNQFEIIDRDIIKGLDYYYAVQSFSKKLPDPFGVMETNILANLKYISPANPVAPDLSRVKVVPNPYIGSAVWNNAIPSDADPWQHRLQFVNLPADATIKIFSLDGDLIDEITSAEIVRKTDDFLGTGSQSVAEWDLITRNNQEAAPGIYMYVVDSPTAGQKIDKFVIVR